MLGRLTAQRAIFEVELAAGDPSSSVLVSNDLLCSRTTSLLPGERPMVFVNHKSDLPWVSGRISNDSCSFLGAYDSSYPLVAEVAVTLVGCQRQAFPPRW